MGNAARADVNGVWVFRQLWRACCSQNASEDECSLSRVASPSFVPSIRLNVATVLLFDDDGSPPCLLTTTKEGRLHGQKLSPTWSGKGHDTWEGREPEECMRRAVDIMQEFWERHHQKGSSSAGEPSCVVWYGDGRHEVLATRLVLKLSSTTKWRKHLAALQGYVVPYRVENGLYRASEDSLFGSCGNMRDGAAKVGLNMLTKAVAKWVMGSSAVESDPRRSQSREPISFHQLPRLAQLESMRAIFVIDINGTLWFSHCSGVRWQPPPIEGEAKAANDPSEGKVLAACQLVADELQNILGRATCTGVSMEECFSHFDSSKMGYVDSCALKKGLTTLGIGVSTNVSRALVLKLGGERATSFSVSDLSRFAHDFEGHIPERRERSFGEIRAENKSIPACDLRSPVVGDPARKTQNCRLAAYTEQKSKLGDRPRTGYAGNRLGKTQIATPHRDDQNSTGTPHLDLDTVDATMTAALPSSYQMGLRHFPNKHRWDDLPCWARQTSRNALGELMGHHKRSLKKKQRESTTHSATSASPTEVPRNADGDIDDAFLDTDRCTSSRSRSTQEPAGSAHQQYVQHVAPSIGASSHAEWHHDRRQKVSDRDPKIHVGGGNVMSYRWITRTVSKSNHGGTVLEAMEGLNASQEALGLRVVRRQPFVLIVMPDLFMTIDYMEKWLGGLLQHNPRGRLLLVGSLGLPGTQWAKGELLDANTQARALNILLWNLLERGELSLDPPLCVVIMGLGSGANAVLHFAGTFLTKAKFTPLRAATRFLSIVNPFPSAPSTPVDTVDTKTKKIFNSLKSLRRVLERGAHHEQLQSLTTALFSAEFIQKHGLERVLEEFWLPRQNLELPQPERPASAPNSHRVNARGAVISRKMPDRTHVPRSKSGLAACIDGVLRGMSLGTSNLDVKVPILLITSTRDALDSSKTAEHCRASLGAEEVDSLFKLMSGNKNGRMMVYPVHAGREVLHEAQTRTLEIISSAIDAAQAQPVTTPLSEIRFIDEDMKESKPQSEVLDAIDSNGGQRRCLSAMLELDATENTGSCEGSSPGGAQRSNSSGVEIGGVASEHVVDSSPTETAAPLDSALDGITSTARGRRDFDVRKERAAERKMKNERLQKRRELDRLKRTQREEQEKVGQQDELILMQKEDERSEAVSRHIRNNEEWASGVVGAKERALELTSARDSKEKKVAEDQLARDRADQHVERVELFRQRKLDLLEHDDTADTEPVQYGGVQNIEVGLARDACLKLLDQLLSMRQRVVKSMKVELLRRDQLANFESQYHKLETDLREAERQQRTYARGGAAANVFGEIPLQELSDIGASVAKQESQFCTFQSVLKERREMWGLAVSDMQRLKIAIRTKETEIRSTLREIGVNIDSLRKAGGRIHAKNEELVMLRAGTKGKTTAMRKRADILTHEMTLLGGHSGPFFDTDIWQPGVTQRMSAARFAQDVQVELVDVQRGIEINVQQTKSLDENLEGGLERGQEIELKMQKLGQIVYMTEERLKRMVAKSVAQELQDILDDEQETHRPDASGATKSNDASLADTIRNKASHYRSLEEKQWVALDILINREQYKALSVLENEELELNDEYKTEHRGEDVARILELPHEIQLALAHLHSPAEIDAHKLLTTYTLEHGDAYFAKVDEESQDHLFATSSGRAQSTPVPVESSQTCTSAGHGTLQEALQEARLPTARAERTDASTQQASTKQPRQYRGPTRLRDLRGARSSLCGSSPTKTHATGVTRSSPPSSSCSRLTTRDAKESVEPLRPEISAVQYDKTPHIKLFNAMSEVTIGGCSASDGEMAVRIGKREVYRSVNSPLGIHESRVHEFTIADQPPTYSVDVKVIVSFTGCIDARGFNRGRVRAVLRRKRNRPGNEGVSGAECIGYSPHARQKLNIGDKFHQTPGTIVIQHCPRRVPLSSGVLEVEVTALGPTKYSVVVVSGQCELCTSLVDKRSAEATNLQERLVILGRELSEMWQGVRLRERQYHVCGTLVAEAQSECIRCQKAIDELCGYLRPHASGANFQSSSGSGTSEHDKSSDSTLSTAGSGKNQPSSTSGSVSSRSRSRTISTSGTSSSTATSSELSETEREERWKEVAAIETEQMHWGHLFTTRCQEKASVKKALRRLMKFRRDGRAEKTRLEDQLHQINFEIPIVTAALRGSNAAAEASRALSLNPGSSSNSRSSSVQTARANVRLETPAEKIRRAFERGGWGTLKLEEQQWVTVDKSLHPDKYIWLEQRDQEEAERELQRGKKARAKPRKNPAIEQCRFDRLELERIMAEPFADLTRREVHVRKLVHKFHDDPKLVKSDCLVEQDGMNDHLLARQTRLKSHKHRTTMEKEWVSLDKILNPQVWKRAKEDVPGTRNDQRPSSAINSGDDTPREEQIWICPFSRDDLLDIWARSADDVSSPNPPSSSSPSTEDQNQALKLLTTYYGPYRGAASNGAVRVWKGVQVGKTTKPPYTDIDERLRCLQQELDRVAHSSNPGINSSVLHSAPQHYPTSTLRLELEAEIDRLLREQVQQRERKNVYLIEDYSSSDEDNDDERREKKAENRRMRRCKRRANRGDTSIYAARKRLLLDVAKTPLQKDKAKRVAMLGPGGCPACMSTPCKRTPVVNVEATNTRLELIADELHFARSSTEDVIESTLPMSVQRDGLTSFRRVELIEDLTSEEKHLRYMLKLHFVDEEFHETHRTSSLHLECVALHGYRTYLWTKDAQIALEREHNRLIARLVATNITHDILDWMLEGWHFGERQSRHKVVGYVPSIQKTGIIKAGTNVQGFDEPIAEEATRLRQKEKDRATTFTLPPGADGSGWNTSSERVVKKGDGHDADIGFMERTMHFGLFCIAIMYFRARWLLRQQRECASNFKLGWNIDTSVLVQAQRKDASQPSHTTQAGHQRVKVRKQKEQAEVLADFAGFLTIERREVHATQLLQRIYRGHIGRKAAHRWRIKRAEYSATNALMVAAAISIQRLMRGTWGRSRAGTIRAGIARWLAHLIDDEGHEFEAELLKTSSVEALKKGIGELLQDDDDEDGEDVSVS